MDDEVDIDVNPDDDTTNPDESVDDPLTICKNQCECQWDDDKCWKICDACWEDYFKEIEGSNDKA